MYLPSIEVWPSGLKLFIITVDSLMAPQVSLPRSYDSKTLASIAKRSYLNKDLNKQGQYLPELLTSRIASRSASPVDNHRLHVEKNIPHNKTPRLETIYQNLINIGDTFVVLYSIPP